VPNTTPSSKPCANSTRLPQDALPQDALPQDALPQDDLPHILPAVAGLLNKLPVTVTPKGLNIHPEATEDQRKRLFRSMKNLSEDAGAWFRFALGDAYNAVTGHGAKTEWVEKTFGGKDAIMPLKKYGAVAKRWPHEDRDMKLPWSFYAEVSVKALDEKRPQLTADYKAGKIKIEGIRALKRGLNGPTEMDELDQDLWPTAVRNDLRLFLQRRGLKDLHDFLRHELYGQEDEEETDSDGPGKSTDVGTFASVDDPENPCSQTSPQPPHVTENADIRSAWEGDTHSPKHSFPPSSPPRASGNTECEKSDNKKEDSYCRISEPTADAELLPYDVLLMILAENRFDFEQREEAVALRDLDNERDPAAVLGSKVLDAVLGHEGKLRALCDLRAEDARLYDNLRSLDTGDPPKATRSQALAWIDKRIEALAACSLALGGTDDGWLDPRDPFADWDQIAALRAKRLCVPQSLGGVL